MDDQRAQILEKIKASNNCLVTVSSNPTVDQLAAAIGLTLLLGKMNKQATAVFSGEVPPAIRFLRPDKTLQKNADNLQDFIISLDKSKADKLRYKVEDDVVRIFITPYKTSLSSRDLTYSKGDFNVELVLALGVARKEDLDSAITAHGRILHDATVVSMTTTEHAQLGTLHLENTRVSGVSEMVFGLAGELGNDLLDERISTALLTGIVAATEHFGNDKTTPMTLTASADLLEAGANQQLVSTELGGQKTRGAVRPGQGGPPARDPNLKSYKQLAREHGAAPDQPQQEPKQDTTKSLPAVMPEEKQLPQPAVPETPVSQPATPLQQKPAFSQPPKSETPQDAGSEQSKAPASETKDEPQSGLEEAPVIEMPPAAEKSAIGDLGTVTPTPTPMMDTHKTLSDLESEAGSPPAPEPADADVDSARKAVESALNASAAPTPEPVTATPDVPAPAPASGLPDFLRTPSMAAAPPPPVAPFPAAAPAPFSAPPVAPPIAPPMPPTIPPAPAGLTPPPPSVPPQPLNPAANEQAPLSMSPADQPFTMPLPPAPQAPLTPADVESDDLPPGLLNNGQQSPPPAPPPLPPIPPSMPPPGPGIPQ